MKRRLLRIFGALGVLIALLVLLGVTYEQVGRWKDRPFLVPPGALLPVDGRTMHLYCTGTGSPAVILESGLGGTADAWARVQPELAADTRACSYDRAGLGGSETRPGPISGEDVVADLHGLLEVGGVAPPWILVGFSAGGLTARLHATRHSESVAGLVLVDASHEDQHERLGFALPPSWVVGWYRRLYRMSLPLGIPRFMARGNSGPEDLDEEVVRRRAATYRHAPILRAELEEMLALDARLAEIRAAREPLGDLPLVVIRAGEPSDGDPESAPWRIWQELQADLLTLSTQSRPVVAEGSGHFIPEQRPDVIVAVVRELLAEVRGETAVPGAPPTR